MKILFITRKSVNCGVADYGLRLFDILKTAFNIILCEIKNEDEYNKAFNEHNPDLVLYNYHFATLPFISDSFISGKRHVKHLAIYHEAHMGFTPDEIISTNIRPLFETLDLSPFKSNDIPNIGSFGFGFPDKDFPRVARLVSEQFEKARLWLNVPFAEFGDKAGYLAMQEMDKVRAIVHQGIELHISHEYLSQRDLLYCLSDNDINLFLYKENHGRGLSSTIDYALSVRKPIGVSSSAQFRHLPKEICVDNITIPELIKKGFELLEKVYEENSNERLIQRYKELLNL